MYEKQHFTSEEYDKLLESMNNNYYSPNADALLRFICEYDGGIICPNRWNQWDPVNKLFDPNDPNIYNEVIKNLSFPQTKIFLKRVKATLRCEIAVDCGDFRPYFEVIGTGKKKTYKLLGDGFKVRPRGTANIDIWAKVSEIKKLKKTPPEFFDEFAQALKAKFDLYKYNTHIEIDPSFYRKLTKEVIYYEIPETHDDCRDE